MQLSVQKALQRQGERLEFRVELGLEPFEFCGDQIAPCGPVLVEGHMMGVEDRIELDGVIHASLKSSCVRCLSEAVLQLRVPFTEKYLREPDEEEPDAFLYEASAVDLDQMVLGNLVMNLPVQILCKEDCKGLCPKCGKNLNEGPCDCDSEPLHSAFAVLKDLKLEEDEP